MSDDRLITAIGRLERALSRIEAKATIPARAPAIIVQRADDGLEERHHLLRARTQAAITRLDQLIGVDASAGNGEDRHD
jgi:hypothetical protein